MNKSFLSLLSISFIIPCAFAQNTPTTTINMHGKWYLGVNLPKTTAARLDVKQGDTLYITSPKQTFLTSSWGSLTLSDCTSKFSTNNTVTTCTVSTINNYTDTLSFGLNAKTTEGTQAAGPLTIKKSSIIKSKNIQLSISGLPSDSSDTLHLTAESGGAKSVDLTAKNSTLQTKLNYGTYNVTADAVVKEKKLYQLTPVELIVNDTQPSKPIHLKFTESKQPTGNFIYSPYKDVGTNLNWNTNVISTKVGTPDQQLEPLVDALPPENKTITLAFATGTCEKESWAGIDPQQFISANLPLLEKKNTGYIISTGGAAGTFQCDSAANMASFINRYQSSQLRGIDFDIEGGYNQKQLDQLMQATAAYQAQHPLRVSLTLATLARPNSTVNTLGIWAIQAAKKAGLKFNVNLMVMDFGSNGCQLNAKGQCDMAKSAIFAANEFSKMYSIPLSRISLTPMIGDNDTADEVTTTADAIAIGHFAKDNHLAGLHYWSYDRDTPCKTATDLLGATATCNTASSSPLAFDQAFLQ